jgi:hypothetical protein
VSKITEKANIVNCTPRETSFPLVFPKNYYIFVVVYLSNTKINLQWIHPVVCLSLYTCIRKQIHIDSVIHTAGCIPSRIIRILLYIRHSDLFWNIFLNCTAQAPGSCVNYRHCACSVGFPISFSHEFAWICIMSVTTPPWHRGRAPLSGMETQCRCTPV